MNQKLALILGVPLLGGALVFVAVSSHKSSEPEQALRRKAPERLYVEAPILSAPPPPPAPKPAPEKTIAQAMDEARLRVTYQNYRTALATGNRIQVDAILPVLRRERKAALRLAEGDLSQATQDFDRTIAQQAVEALRR